MTCAELALIASGISSLRHIGTFESRGKGHVKCTLLKDGEDITRKYLDEFLHKVVSYTT